MNNELKLRQVHFQITRNCNLRCSFCGQWGKKGFFADSQGEELEFSDWERIISELEEEKPLITIWGGEPLVSPYFDRLIILLHEKGFRTEIITNGLLIDKHRDVIESCVDTVYVSVDGTCDIHDSIRGKGVFSKVSSNIKSLKHKNIVIMTVITKELLVELPMFLDELNSWNIKSLYLQDMIGLSASEIEQYEEWMRTDFGIDSKYAKSWYNADLEKYDIGNLKKYSFDIQHLKHTVEDSCLSPFHHIHIAWNGEVMYCTDHYDFSAGNVRDENVMSLFTNEKSEKFRKGIRDGKNPTCRHCSWKLKRSFE